MLESLIVLLSDYTVCTIILGTSILGATAGAVGVFAVLRKQSLLSDALSHAALPGIACMFLMTHSKNQALLLCGGAFASGIASLFISFVVQKTTLKKDAVLGAVLSTFFGLGLVLMTVIQKKAVANQAVLNKFLFGTSATLLREDVQMMAIVSVVIFISIFILWKECKLFIFDSQFAHTSSFSVNCINTCITSLLVATIVIGLQTVGVVLMSALLVAPAAAARQWTSVYGYMMLLASFFGAISGSVGAVISTIIGIPTGPTIVVVMSVIVLFSLLFSPHRGLLHGIIKQRTMKYKEWQKNQEFYAK